MDYLINSLVPYRELPGAYRIFLGSAPQSLVSARSCLHRVTNHIDRSAGFAQGCDASLAGLGFPEFTSFSTTVACGSQDSGMNFSMAVSAQKDAFVSFFFNLFPTSSISFLRYAKFFFRWVKVMKL